MSSDATNTKPKSPGGRPGVDAVSDMLQQPHHGTSGELPPTDPVGTTPMVVAIEKIVSYDNNPRSAENAMYDDIKASISANGLQQPLVITRRPGDEHYMIRAGGNTRLTVVKDLHAETNDPRFAQVNVLFEPWVSESDTLTAHLIENDTRGDLIFIDRAIAISKLKQLLETEIGKTLSQNALSKALAERGYKLSQSLISQMTYALDVLLPVIPTALNTGMGKPQIEKLRTLDKAARKLWLHHNDSEEAGFDVLWAGVLGGCDGDVWHYDECRSGLETNLSEQLPLSIHQTKLDLATALAGRPLGQTTQAKPLHTPPIDTANNDGDGQSSNQRDDDTIDWVDSSNNGASNDGGNSPAAPFTLVKPDNETPDDSGNGNVADDDPTWPPVVNEGDEDEHPLDDNGSSSSVAPTPTTPQNTSSDVDPRPPVTETPTTTDDLPVDLKSLRGRAYTLAAKIAQRHHMNDLLAASPSWGFGYLLNDILTQTPERKAMTQGDLATSVFIWWQLAACAEMTVDEIDAIAERLPQGKLREALEAANLGILAANGMVIEPGLQGAYFWAQLPQSSLDDLFNLIATYRAMKNLIDTKGLDIWGD